MKKTIRDFNQELYQLNKKPDILDLKSIIQKTYSDQFNEMLINEMSEFNTIHSFYYYLQLEKPSKNTEYIYQYEGFIELEYNQYDSLWQVHISIRSKNVNEFLDHLKRMNEKLVSDSVPYMASIN